MKKDLNTQIQTPTKLVPLKEHDDFKHRVRQEKLWHSRLAFVANLAFVIFQVGIACLIVADRKNALFYTGLVGGLKPISTHLTCLYRETNDRRDQSEDKSS